MTDTVIDRFNIIGKYQPEPFLFNDHRGQIIGYDGVEITGVDRDENDAPLPKVENEKDNIYDQEDQEEVYPEQEDQNIQQPLKVELEPLG